MTAIVQRHLTGQTRFGIFTNLTDKRDRATLGGWYVAIHFLTLRLTILGGEG